MLKENRKDSFERNRNGWNNQIKKESQAEKRRQTNGEPIQIFLPCPLRREKGQLGAMLLRL